MITPRSWKNVVEITYYNDDGAYRTVEIDDETLVPASELAEANAQLEKLQSALEERNRDMVRATENYNRINGLRNDANAQRDEALAAITFAHGALGTIACDCREIDGHRDACPRCQAHSTLEALLAKAGAP